MRKKILLICQLVLLLLAASPLNIRADEVTDESLYEDFGDDAYDESKQSDLDLYYQADSLNVLKEQSSSYESLYKRYLNQAKTTKSGYVIYEDVLLDYVGKSTKLTIPSNVTKIYGLNFENKNKKVKQVTIPASVTDIRNSFHCSSWASGGTRIIFSERNGNPLSIGNFCFEDLGSDDCFCPVIPKETTDIGYGCFVGCNLTDVQIPDGITVLRENTFSSHHGIRMELPKSVTKIEDNVFGKIGIGSIVEQPGSVATVTVPSTVTSIGKKCFTTLDEQGVICKKGSTTEKYCKKNNISYTTAPKIKFLRNTYYVCEGTRQFLPLYVWDKPAKVAYTTKNRSCATIGENKYLSDGVYVVGKKAGTTTLTAKYNGKKYQTKIIVLKLTESNRVKQAVHNATTSKMSKLEKAMALSDWMFTQCGYDYDYYYGGTKTHKYSPHTSQAALLDGLAVCDGYAYACKMLYDKVGLENKIITGTSQGNGHAWNLVKVEGGWIHMDTTNLIYGSDKEVKEAGLKWNTSKYPKATVKAGD